MSCRLEQHPKIWSVSVHDSDAAKMSRMKCEWCEKKFLVKFSECGVCVCVCEDDVSLPRQGTTPQILKADISCAYIGPETET